VSGRRRAARFVVWCTLVATASCTSAPPLTLRAPGRIEQALVERVVSELTAVAVLVPTGGSPFAPVPLARGDDGISFSGFLEAEPGQYTLEVVFSGVPLAPVSGGAGPRFLGRLSSDAFTVTQGQSTTPVFSRAVDTIGRDGEGGDDDADGLGFLDELLLGTDPARPDSDDDGLLDGEDCRPADPQSTFRILEGGSIEDCDADGFRAVTSPFGPPGLDCDDENPAVHPGVRDDCSNSIDEDCNPQTCPIADFEGPVITPVAPLPGATIGCHTPFTFEIEDPSDVQSASIVAEGFPVAGFPRTVLLTRDAENEALWVAPQGFGNTGGGLVSGPLRVQAQAADFSGNSTAARLDLTLALAYPLVTLGGATVIGDGPPVDVSLTPAGPRPLALLELRAAPMDGNGLLDLTREVRLGSVATSGGSVRVDPADLPGTFAVYPFARDDVGNELAPSRIGAVFNAGTSSVTSSFFCDGVGREVPVIVRRQNIGPALMRDHLQEAIDIARGIDDTAYLVKIIGFGLQGDGAIDLSDTRQEFRGWIYGFMTPARVLDERGISVTWFASGFLFGRSNPVVNADDGGTFQVDALVNTAQFPDSDAIAAAFPCGGNGWVGNANDDTLIIIRDEDAGRDQLIMSTRDDYSWGVFANDLTRETFGCSCPSGVSCP
jgi:hypothetical protein